MNDFILSNVQQRVDEIVIPKFEKLHHFEGVSQSFTPWGSGLSPSALYNCSLSCRKKMGIKTTEVKWMSIKRWVSLTPYGITLPTGVYLSIKRREMFIAKPHPHFEKQEFILMMFPYGNVWSQKIVDAPICEDWLWSVAEDNRLIFEHLMRKDAAFPVHGYFKSCHEYMRNFPDQIGIHLKRRPKQDANSNV